MHKEKKEVRKKDSSWKAWFIIGTIQGVVLVAIIVMYFMGYF
ncbi:MULTISPECIES: hypothetical protein [unclassified Bacillus (in: firmicutes)]|nr:MULTISPECIES: hypothetical protein [unclassified Bacillus (in: firmicutes)]